MSLEQWVLDPIVVLLRGSIYILHKLYRGLHSYKLFIKVYTHIIYLYIQVNLYIYIYTVYQIKNDFTLS